MDSPRVVITGMGLITPLGNSKDLVWDALKSGGSGIREFQSLPHDKLPVPYAGEAWDFSGAIDNFGTLEKAQMRAIKKGTRLMCREIQMGVAAAQLALQDAASEGFVPDPERSGVIYGSDYILTQPQEFSDGVANCTEGEDFDFTKWGRDGLPKVQPLWLLKYLPNMPASHIAIYNDFRGPNNSLTLREAASNAAIAEAFQTIRRGSADLLIAGATGTRIHPLRSVHVLLQEQVALDLDLPGDAWSRPFDAQRQGMVMAEGSGALILETLESAEKRGATIYGEVVAAATSAVTTVDGNADLATACKNVIRGCLDRSGLQAAQLGHVHAHGLSTVQGDLAESLAIGELLPGVPTVAAKANLGNMGAAGGVTEGIASLLALNAGHLFPIRNLDQLDDACPITPAGADTPAGDSFINLSYTPQGQTSAILVKRFA